MNIRRFGPEDVPAIARLNARLTAGGVRLPFYVERPSDVDAASPVLSRLFIAVNGQEVRGGIWLSEHDFWINGTLMRAGWARYPVAESLIDPAYGGVAGALVIRLLREQPRLMALGMGGHGGPFARLLRGIGWRGATVPFYFLPVRPARVLHRLRYLRRTFARRAALDALAASGLGWIGCRVLELLRGATRLAPPAGYRCDIVERFDGWADALWERVRGAYEFVGRRDAQMLEAVFRHDLPVVRLRIRRGDVDVGWACVVLREFTDADPGPFGPLRIGLIADALAEPAEARSVTAAATAYLRGSDVDLVFSNQAHPAWGGALRHAGFFSGPSQFALYWSRPMDAYLGSGRALEVCHVNRGDCDGPVFW